MVYELILGECFSYGQELSKDGPETPGGGEAAVAVAGPVDGEFGDSAGLLSCPHYDFHIKHKAVGNTLAVELAGDVAFVYLEAALRIGEFSGYFHTVNHKPMKNLRTNPPMPALRPLNLALTKLSRPVRYIAGSAFEHVQPLQNISVRNTTAAIGEHYIFTARLFDTCANGAALSVVLLQADDLK